MQLILAWIVLIALNFINCQTSEVCYEDLGCFSNQYPFYDPVLRPIKSLPDSPQVINTQFFLYSYVNPSLPQELHPKKFETIKYSTLSKKLKLKIIIHGFVKNIHKTNEWIHKTINKYLKSEPLNVIFVDWTDGALDYTQSVNNARVVGSQLAQIITTLKNIVSTPLSAIHLIGHDVGAHVAGYAGHRLNGTIGRISGISSASLYFDGLPNDVKLDKSDAKVVDIINDLSEILD